MKSKIIATIIILISLLVILGLGLSAWKQLKQSWAEKALKVQAQAELVEKKESSKIRLADEAISILRDRIQSIQEKQNGVRLCEFVLSNHWRKNLSPSVLQYRLDRCVGYGHTEDVTDVIRDTLMAIRLMVTMDHVTDSNPQGEVGEILSRYEKERAVYDCDASKEGREICEKLEARLQQIESFPIVPAPAEKPASK